MDMENMQTLSFELSPNQLKYKTLLNKDFLLLEIWAISDVDPNRNDTHFTIESMKEALPTFKNKPIIGLFEKGDFGSHDGVYRKDIETGLNWWDTEHGERILGVIRESDNVEIVEKDNLNWIKFTCVLFVKYCYKQVKRLLKDRTKRVSVEITTHRVMERDDGVRDILSFTLNGVTILGTKNGRPVIEAIPGAHLSVIEQMDETIMESQKKVLCFAYDQYDQANDNKNLVKEENSVEEIVKDSDGIVNENEENPVSSEATSTETFEAVGETNPPKQECEEAVKEPAGEVVENCSSTEPEEYAASQENECVIPAGDNQQQFDELQCKYQKLFADYETMSEEFEQMKCKNQEYCDKISEYENKMQQFDDYEEIKNALKDAQCKLAEIAEKDKKQKMFNYAESIMANETIIDEDKNEIIMKINDLKYSSNEEIEKDVAYACYKARVKKPEGGRVEFSAPISTSYVDQKSEKPMTREERLAQKRKNGKK